HHAEQVDVLNIPKLAVLLAAFQLRRDLRDTLDETHPKNLTELFSEQRHRWAAAQTAPDPKIIPPEPFAPPVYRLGNTVFLDGKGGLKPVTLRDPKSPRLEEVFTGDPVQGQDAIDFTSTGERWGDVVEFAHGVLDRKAGEGNRLQLL